MHRAAFLTCIRCSRASPGFAQTRLRCPCVCCVVVCRSIFDIDNIDIGPERRAYLEQKLERVWEQNTQVCAALTPGLCKPK